MRTGEVKLEAVSVFCPYCGEAYQWPQTGSTVLTSGDDLDLRALDQVSKLQCFDCGQAFRVPAVARRVGR